MTADLFFYGLLQRGLPDWVELRLDACLEEVGPDSISGTLYDLGDYPGAVLGGEGAIHGCVFALTEPAALARLDAYEGFDPASPETSLYRRMRTVTRQGHDVWVYVPVQPLEDRPVIPGGRWADR